MSWEDGDAPDGWRLCALQEVATVVGGGTPKTGVPGNFLDSGGHPWVTPADLTGYTEQYIGRGRRFLTDQGLAMSSAKYMPAGTVLFSSRAPIGYVAVASNPLTTNQGFRSFVPSDELDSDYLFFALRFLRPVAEQLASGTTFAELSGSNAGRMRIAFPSISEQCTIARTLGSADRLRRSASGHLSAAAGAIARFRQAVIAAACSGRLTADWRELNRCSPVLPGPELSTQAIAHTSGAPNTDDLLTIPSSWSWWSVEGITERVIDYRGRTPPSEVTGPIPHVRTTQIRNGRIDWNTDRFVSEETYAAYMTRGIPRRGDVLFTMEAPMGEVGVVDRDEPFSIAQRILLLRPANDLLGDFLALSLQSAPVRRAIEYRSTGSGVLGIAYKRFRSVSLPKPPLDEQREIVSRVAQLIELADRVEAKVRSAEHRIGRSEQGVLAMAFRGELNGSLPDFPTT